MQRQILFIFRISRLFIRGNRTDRCPNAKLQSQHCQTTICGVRMVKTQAVLQGVAFTGGASLKAEKAHFASWKKGPENRKHEVKLRPPLLAARKSHQSPRWPWAGSEPFRCRNRRGFFSSPAAKKSLAASDFWRLPQEARNDHGRKLPQPCDFAAAATTGH